MNFKKWIRAFYARPATSAFVSAQLLLGAACLPDHLNQFDGQLASAAFEKIGDEPVMLRDTSGNPFELKAAAVNVQFEINRVKDSRLTITDRGKKALFYLPKTALNTSGSTFSLSYVKSKQPVDLHAEESMKVLRKWSKYRHETTPVYSTSCTSDGSGGTTCSSYIAYYSDDYYRDNYGLVDRSLDVLIYARGASFRDFPEAMKRGRLTMLVTHEEELLSTESISWNEYSSAH